jgi:hypothetical protein
MKTKHIISTLMIAFTVVSQGATVLLSEVPVTTFTGPTPILASARTMGFGSPYTEDPTDITGLGVRWQGVAPSGTFNISIGGTQFALIQNDPLAPSTNWLWTSDSSAVLALESHFALNNPSGFQLLSPTASIPSSGNTVLAFGYTVIPEPSSLTLLGLGALGIIIRRRPRIQK